jgi:hypothetical protein
MILMASASGNTVAAIARLVQAREDTVRGFDPAFNERGLAPSRGRLASADLFG